MELNSLKPSTPYNYRMVSQDVSGNVAVSGEASFTTLPIQVDHLTLTNPGDPVIAQYSDTEAVVYLQVSNTTATSKLCYSEAPIANVDSCATYKEINTPTRTHYFHLTGPLKVDTKYYLKSKIIDSENVDNKFVSSDNVFFTTRKAQVNQHAPLTSIGTPTVSVTGSSATISFNTDQLALCIIKTGFSSGNYDDTQYKEFGYDGQANFNQHHIIDITGLTAHTAYFYQITCNDDIHTTAISSADGLNFETTIVIDPAYHEAINDISTIVATPVDIKAAITFDTDQSALCIIESGTAIGIYNNNSSEEVGYNTQKLNWHHSVDILGLTAGTKYYYKINCVDSLNNAKASEEQSFTTVSLGIVVDTTTPVISNVNTGSITGESVTVVWDTNEKASGSVAYGITSGTYENMAGDYLINSAAVNFATAHSVIINGLVPAIKYYFVVVSTDTAGNIAKSSESSFATAAPSSLSSISVSSTNLNQAIITWKTSQKTTSGVEYGLTDQYGQKKEDSAMAIAHSVTLSGLESGQLYHFRVKGKDINNNLYSSGDYTFQPKSPPQIKNVKVAGITEHEITINFTTNIPTDTLITYNDAKNPENSGSQGNPQLGLAHEIVLKNLAPGEVMSFSIKVRDEQGNETVQEGGSFTTGKDTTPPKLDNIKTDSALAQNDKVQTIISWITDEPATTSLTYQEGRQGELKDVKISDSLTTNHVAVITVFKPGMVYYFKVKSTDASGNLATSTDFALLTPKKKENIIQIIVGNFQDIFGWIKLN
jgi:hypothetical protein